jgi:hypothetical protein
MNGCEVSKDGKHKLPIFGGGQQVATGNTRVNGSKVEEEYDLYKTCKECGQSVYVTTVWK